MKLTRRQIVGRGNFLGKSEEAIFGQVQEKLLGELREILDKQGVWWYA